MRTSGTTTTTNHGTQPSVKGPGTAPHDPGEICDTYDVNGNGDDLCPPTTTTTKPSTTTTTQPVATTTTTQPATTTTTVPTTTVTTAPPRLPDTGAPNYLPTIEVIGLTFVLIGARFLYWAKHETS